MDTDLDKAQEELATANNKLEEASKAAANVNIINMFNYAMMKL